MSTVTSTDLVVRHCFNWIHKLVFSHFEDCGSYVANAAKIPPETLPFQLQNCLYAFYPICSSSHSTNLNMCFKICTSCASAVHILSGSQHASYTASACEDKLFGKI